MTNIPDAYEAELPQASGLEKFLLQCGRGCSSADPAARASIQFSKTSVNERQTCRYAVRVGTRARISCL
jgi:hypothetical protein